LRLMAEYAAWFAMNARAPQPTTKVEQGHIGCKKSNLLPRKEQP